MKKLILILVTMMILLVVTVGLASANAGPHGGYTATTDACAGCHRAHTATGPKLLINSSTYALCISCHGTAGTGADTNVEDGVFTEARSTSTDGTLNTTNNAPLLGGGFSYYKGITTTSSHDADGTVTDLAWGNGVARGTSAAIDGGNLTCASCHDPHGSPNYRIIKATVNLIGVSAAQVDEDDVAFCPGGDCKDYDTEQWGAGMSGICAACHSDYHQTTVGQGSILDGASYTHRIDMSYSYGSNANPETVGFSSDGVITYTLPLAETGTNNTVVCTTCHLPHGSSAAMTGFADGGPTGIGVLPGNTTAGDSALLRLDNRGVCEVCHQK